MSTDQIMRTLRLHTRPPWRQCAVCDHVCCRLQRCVCVCRGWSQGEAQAAAQREGAAEAVREGEARLKAVQDEGRKLDKVILELMGKCVTSSCLPRGPHLVQRSTSGGAPHRVRCESDVQAVAVQVLENRFTAHVGFERAGSAS